MSESSRRNQSPVSLAAQRACAEALGLARARMASRPDAPGPSLDSAPSVFFEAVARMDLPRAKDAWSRLGADGLSVLGEKRSSSSSSSPTTIFVTWLCSARQGYAWGVKDEAVIDMALWLDAIGASAGGPPEWAAAMAKGGADKLACRIGSIAIWTQAADDPRESFTPAILRALSLLAKRWASDSDRAAQAAPQRWIDAAFSCPDGSARKSGHVNLLAEVWPIFGIEPPPEMWRSLAKGWVLGLDAFCGERSVAAIGKLLSMGSALLEPAVADRLCFMAARLDFASLLAQIAARSETFPLCVEPSELDSPESKDLVEKLPRGPFSGRCPLIFVAASSKFPKPPSDSWRHVPSTPEHPQGLCFGVLASIPEAVAEADAFPRPDLISLIPPSALPGIFASHPAWFAPNDQGQNFLHFMARRNEWGDVPQSAAALFSLFSANDDFAAMFSAKDCSGIAPIEAFMESAKSHTLAFAAFSAIGYSANKPLEDAPLIQRLSALAEACQLRESISAPSTAARCASPRI